MTLNADKKFEMTARQKQAFDMVRDTNNSFFLTGRAGTGKTTFLRRIQKEIDKKFIVVAQTGIAAIVAGGETINSFFGMPFHVLTAKTALNINPNKQEVLRAVDTIIIDEVSMVRCDEVDAIDRVLRKLMLNNLPFGGKQMIFSGDMFQLEPIVGDEAEKEMLEHEYGSDKPYFYKAHVFEHFTLPRIEFTEVFRQDDPVFLNVLNNVRNFIVSPNDMTILNRHIVSGEPDGMAIILSPYRKSVDKINESHLNKLDGESFTYEATVDGNFKESQMPVDKQLVLKVGAQVMFTHNDSSHRWVNGSLGIVTELSNDAIHVKMQTGDIEYAVDKASWESYAYTYDRKSKSLSKELVGTFSQYPLRLAWAITIHKSQGLTFDKMVLDLSRGVFSSGQLYVALSRVKSLDGLSLTAPVSPNHVHLNPEIMAFANTFNDEALIAEELKDGSAIYPHLRKKHWDEAALVCLELAAEKMKDGKLREASLMLKKMFDIAVCDDCLMGKTGHFEPLKAESMIANFINAVMCLYSNQPDLAIVYADRVLARKDSCTQAHYVKARALAMQGRWKEADAVNVRILEMLDDEVSKDSKTIYLLSVVNAQIGDPSLEYMNFLLKNHRQYLPIVLEMRRQIKTQNFEMKTDAKNELLDAFKSDMSEVEFCALCQSHMEDDTYKAMISEIVQQKFEDS